jgi:hypothetical protein
MDDLRINFADVEGQKDFSPIPPSRQTVVVTEWQQGEVMSEESENKGALKLTFELTVQDGEYANRRIWDTFTVVKSSLWKLKAFFGALGENMEREITVDELLDMAANAIGQQLDVKLGIQPARRDNRTGNEYGARNRVQQYYPAGKSDSNGGMLP